MTVGTNVWIGLATAGAAAKSTRRGDHAGRRSPRKKPENRRQDRLAIRGGLSLSVGDPGWARGGI